MSTDSKILTPVITSSTAKDILATVDVYKEKAKGVVNDVTDYLDQYGINRALFSKGMKAAKELIPLVNAFRSGASGPELFNRLMTAAGPNSSLLKMLPGDMGTSIGAYVGDIGEQAMIYADAINYVNSTDFTSISSLTRLVNGVTGDPNLMRFEDRDGITGLYVGMIAEARELGLPSILGKLGEYQKDVEIMQRTAAGTIQTAIRFSDTVMMRDINKTLGTGNLESSSPGATKEFMENYTYNEQINREPGHVRYEDMITMLDDIEPEWRFSARGLNGEEPIFDATVFRRSSEDAKEVLTNGMKSDTLESKDENLYVIAVKDIPPYTVRQAVDTMIYGRQPI